MWETFDGDNEWTDGGLGIMTRMGAHHQPRPPHGGGGGGGPEIFCAPGYVLTNGRCIAPENCPDGRVDPLTGRCIRMPVDPVCIQVGTTPEGAPIYAGGPGCPSTPGTTTPYPGFGQPGTNAPPGSLLPVPFTPVPISQSYIDKYTARFGKKPLLPGAYTGKFTMPEWSPSPGGPGLSALNCNCGGSCASCSGDRGGPFGNGPHADNNALFLLVGLAVGAYFLLRR